MDFFLKSDPAKSATTDVFAWNWELMQDKTCRTIINQGGTSSGKTYSICQCLLLWAFQNGNKLITITGQDLPQIKRDVLNEFKKVINTSVLQKVNNGAAKTPYEYEYNKSDNVFSFGNGTRIEFVAYGDADDAKGKRDVLYVFECNNVAYDIYRELAVRTSTKILLCYNPTARFYVHENIIPQSDSSLIISNFENNTYLSSNIRNELLSLKDETSPNYDLYRWRTMGQGRTGQISGLCFPKCYQITPSEFPNDPKKTCYGLDWGFGADPFVLCQLSLYDNRLFARELIYETGLLNIDLNRIFIELGLTRFDKIIADKSSPKDIADMCRLGWNVQKSQGAKISFGIKKINEYNLYMTSDSKNAWIEQQKYIIDPRTNEPITKFNHFWDATRYAHEGLFTDNSAPKASRLTRI